MARNKRPNGEGQRAGLKRGRPAATGDEAADQPEPSGQDVANDDPAAEMMEQQVRQQPDAVVDRRAGWAAAARRYRASMPCKYAIVVENSAGCMVMDVQSANSFPLLSSVLFRANLTSHAFRLTRTTWCFSGALHILHTMQMQTKVARRTTSIQEATRYLACAPPPLMCIRKSSLQQSCCSPCLCSCQDFHSCKVHTSPASLNMSARWGVHDC